MRPNLFLLLCLSIPLAPAGAADTRGAVPAGSGWHALATRHDRTRLRDWRKTWVKALALAKASGNQARVDAEGPLLQPDAALSAVTPPAGEYRCRTIKIGARRAGMPDLVAYAPVRCRIAAGEAGLSFAVLNGAQRPQGRLFAEGLRRMMFLGTLQLGDEQGVMRYSHDELRDLAGFIERVGERRWRVVLPAPHFESDLDVIELIPKD